MHDNELQDDYEFVFHILKECAFMNFMIIFFFHNLKFGVNDTIVDKHTNIIASYKHCKFVNLFTIVISYTVLTCVRYHHEYMIICRFYLIL